MTGMLGGFLLMAIGFLGARILIATFVSGLSMETLGGMVSLIKDKKPNALLAHDLLEEQVCDLLQDKPVIGETLISKKANELSPVTRVKANDISSLSEAEAVVNAGDDETSEVTDSGAGKSQNEGQSEKKRLAMRKTI
jgi:hypothetical protein